MLGLSEVRWPGAACIVTSTEVTTEALFTLEVSPQGSKGNVNPRLTRYCAISNRVLLAHIKVAPFNICLIQVYAPTTEHEEYVDQFYLEIDQPREHCKEHEVIVLT